MDNSKNKNLAALLAFFGGIVGLHRFYLGQKGLGFLMIFLAIVSMGVISSILGVIDSILFLKSSEEKFDLKYNNEDGISSSRTRPRYKSYERRYKSQQNPSDTTPRRDRRMGKREFQDRRRNNERKSSDPYRQPRTRRSSRKDRQLRKEAEKKIYTLKQSGIEKFKDYDIEGSILDFNEILRIDPRNIAAHFNLACAYSQLEKPEKSMHHISEAVNAGFDDFDRIKKHEKLAFARIQPEWEDFVKNGFVFDTKTEEIENPIKDQPVATDNENQDSETTAGSDLLEHLNILKEQRERGIISETEFEIQRKKLMSS